jgi:hypothetical protein
MLAPRPLYRGQLILPYKRKDKNAGLQRKLPLILCGAPLERAFEMLHAPAY